jgi:hypothetical protein
MRDISPGGRAVRALLESARGRVPRAGRQLLDWSVERGATLVAQQPLGGPMKTFAALALVASSLAVAAPSPAGQRISSPALPTEVNNASACYIRNVGPVPVSLQAKLYQYFGSDLAPSYDGCNGTPLAPGRSCVLLVNDLPDDVIVACAADVAGSAKFLRGTLELRQITSSGLVTLIAADLR